MTSVGMVDLLATLASLASDDMCGAKKADRRTQGLRLCGRVEPVSAQPMSPWRVPHVRGGKPVDRQARLCRVVCSLHAKDSRDATVCMAFVDAAHYTPDERTSPVLTTNALSR